MSGTRTPCARSNEGFLHAAREKEPPELHRWQLQIYELRAEWEQERVELLEERSGLADGAGRRSCIAKGSSRLNMNGSHWSLLAQSWRRCAGL